MPQISPVWFPETSFKSTFEPAVLAEHSRVFHFNDQCGSVKFLPHGSPVPYDGRHGLTPCYHCQQHTEQGR